MTDRDVVLAKVDTIQRCLRRIRDVTGLEPDSLDDQDREDIFVLNLQRAVQAVIDLAAHVVSRRGLGLAQHVRDNFQFLYESKIIDKDLAGRMQKMIGFRNIAIHDYQALDRAILKSILTLNLRDLEEFYTVLLLYLGYIEDPEES